MKFFLSLFSICLFSCGSYFQTSTYDAKSIAVKKGALKDSSIYYMLKPYADSINYKMNLPVATLTADLEKQQPNGSLGLVFVDAMRAAAEKVYATKVDGALINNGGLRIPSIKAGTITIGKIYEVMPFDNLLVIQKMSGKVLREFLQLTIKKGGWPMSGISIKVINSSISITIGNEQLDDNKIYTIANSDYIANGGDDAIMLKPIPQMSKGYLLRDAFIEEFKQQKTINAINEQRFTKITT